MTDILPSTTIGKIQRDPDTEAAVDKLCDKVNELIMALETSEKEIDKLMNIIVERIGGIQPRRTAKRVE